MEPAAWPASLPTLIGTSCALITAPSGEVLLVKPNYRDHWSVPGGVLEFGERPEEGCVREVREELGLDLPADPMLVVQWLPVEGVRSKPVMAFVFDGGVIDDPSRIVLQEEELDDYRLAPPAELEKYLPGVTLERMTGALRARESGAPVYLSS